MDRRCCVPNCGKSRNDDTVLHAFPNPDKDRDLYLKWVNAVRLNTSLDPNYLYKNRRVCHDHFEVKFLTWTRRLIPGAVPTLLLAGSENILLHSFPHPVTERDRFTAWINAFGSSISSLSHEHIYKNRKICSDHFEPKFMTWKGRLSNIAVPTLLMPDRRPDVVHRKCLKCGRSPAQDPDTQLFRFPKPGLTNTIQCEAWAKFCYPNEAWSSTDFQEKLYSEHKMLCDKHFSRFAFVTENRLNPDDAIPEPEDIESSEALHEFKVDRPDSSQAQHRMREESDSSIPRLWHLRHELARGANHLSCESWAKFCFPDHPWSSPKFQEQLFSENKVLCDEDQALALQAYLGPSSNESLRSQPAPSLVEQITITEVQDRNAEMAIVEDEVWNESEEENEIEVVVEEYNGEQDSDDSDDDDDADDEALERKVADLELRIKEDPYNYDDHIELIQALWGLSELDRWRAAFDRLQQMTPLKPEHWLMRLQTESQLSHTPEARVAIAELFQQATLDCYYIQIFSEWCSWSLSGGDVSHTRTQMQEVLKLAGADPLSGKLFWEAKLDFEKALLESMSEEDDKYKEQRERVLFCLEEIVSRPLLHGEELWSEFTELASTIHGQDYVDKVKKQHEAALEYLQKISPFEDRLLTLQNVEEKYIAYLEYIDTVVELSKQDRYRECDSDGILKVLYERASSDCSTHSSHTDLLSRYARFTRLRCSRASAARALRVGTRRAPRCHLFWTMQMQQAEHEEKDFTEIKNIFETALSKGMESYKQSEHLWMSYVEYVRRQTDFNDEQKVDRLRDTLRLAWDSLAELWGDEANDCEIPLFWARLEYTLMKDHKRGKEIFEEIFRYGENKTMSKYWEALVRLEMNRAPPISENKLRELFRRALRSVTDYPPAIVAMWTDYERIYGRLDTLVECNDTCEEKLKEWREYYKAMKEKMTGKKQKTNKQTDKKPNKPKFDKRKAQDDNPKKRKSDDSGQGSEVKKKRDDIEVDVKDKEGNSAGVKRSHETEDSEVKDKKRQRRDSSEGSRSPARDACTLFVSNLEFKVNEKNLRNKLSEYGDIVSLRVKSGVKAFGGSICYCQYKNRNSVDKALKHDRTPLDGRPMFFSRYSANKGKPQFKYATTTEKNKLFVRNLPFASCTKDALTEIFGEHGKLKDVRVVTYKDGKPKGLAYIEYEDEASAAQALDKTNGLKVGDKNIEVAVSAPPPRADTSQAMLGQPKREPTGGMRRTQLSSFIPSVLANAKPSTSKAPDTHANGDEKRPLSNDDFRSMLLQNK